MIKVRFFEKEIKVPSQEEGIGSDWVLVEHKEFDADSGQSGYQILTHTLVKIQNWMNCNCLQMNALKTELIVFRVKLRLNNLQ